MTVIKRDRKATSADLVAAIERLIVLLHDQKEDDAIAFLEETLDLFKKAAPGSPEQTVAVERFLDAFHGDHELIAYTHQRESSGDAWTEAEELSLVSARVLNLVRRMQKG
jgi:hypothetical protein